MMKHFLILKTNRSTALMLVAVSLVLGGCLAEILSTRQGAVRFYDSLPGSCDKPTNLKQKKIKAVHSMQELEKHYRLSMQVHFQDGESPRLVGSIFYQDRPNGFYCMALPDGRFASIQDSKINGKPNMVQDICYPLKTCKVH